MSPNEWWDEVRRAARRLGRAPGFAAIVILTLGLGVGANTAIFTVLDAVLLEELPYAEPERLVRVYEDNEERPQLQFIRAPVVAEWMRWDEVFEQVGALYTYREVGADLTSGSAPRRRAARLGGAFRSRSGAGAPLGRARPDPRCHRGPELHRDRRRPHRGGDRRLRQ